MKTILPLLPPVQGHVSKGHGGLCESDLRRLVDHGSMKVYYDVQISDDGAFILPERSTTTARTELIVPTLKEVFDQLGDTATVLDLACSPGYFLFKLAQFGALRLVGVDARDDHYDQFRLLNSFYGYSNISFVHADLYEFLKREGAAGHVYELCLLFGFLYHTPTPVELLRQIRRICGHSLIIDTTLSFNDDASLIVRREQTDWSRASTTPINMMPSLKAVPLLLEAAGFQNIKRVVPSPDLYQFSPGGPNIDYYFDQLKPKGEDPKKLNPLRRAFFMAYAS